MAKFSLFELHLEGADFVANAPFSGGRDDPEADLEISGVDEADLPSSSGAMKLGLLAAAGLGALLVAVVVLKKLRGSGDAAIADLGDDFEDETETEIEV